MAEVKVEFSSPASSTNTDVTTPSPSNEYFDDVFGSAPPSPVIDHGGSSAEISGANDADTDQRLHKESSDVAKLRSTHTSAGYRDGFTAAKEAALQPGFDEGYSLGAVVGLRAGLIVGMMEALQEGLDFGKNEESLSKLQALVSKCREDLQRSSLLSDDYIDMEGLWKWQTPMDADIHDVVAAHPLVQRWQSRVHLMCTRLNVDSRKLEERWLDESQDTELSVNKQLSSAAGDSVVTSQVFEF